MFRRLGPGRKRRDAVSLLPRLRWLVLLVLAAAGAAFAHSDTPDAGSAAALRAKYEALRDELAHNPFHQPLVLESKETEERLEGDLYGVVDHPFATVDAALKVAAHWCDVLMLHLNVKDCRTSAGGVPTSLTVYIGSKYDQPPEAAFRVEYAYRVAAEAPDYLRIALAADTGPFGTKDYRIRFEAIPLEREQTFIRLTYSYAYGTMAKMALQTYLATVGRSKVGFTVVGRQPGGEPVYVTGVRGVVERNAMRYYLAIVAYLDALSAPPNEQLDRRLREWFAFTEQHARQLHELGQREYLDMKRREYRRP
jgi:hypothetical protein